MRRSRHDTAQVTQRTWDGFKAFWNLRFMSTNICRHRVSCRAAVEVGSIPTCLPGSHSCWQHLHWQCRVFQSSSHVFCARTSDSHPSSDTSTTVSLAQSHPLPNCRLHAHHSSHLPHIILQAFLSLNHSDHLCVMALMRDNPVPHLLLYVTVCCLDYIEHLSSCRCDRTADLAGVCV